MSLIFIDLTLVTNILDTKLKVLILIIGLIMLVMPIKITTQKCYLMNLMVQVYLGQLLMEYHST